MTTETNITRKLNGRKVIKISHELNLSSYSFGIISMDILFTAIAQIADEDKELKEYLISISELERKIGRKLNRVSLQNTYEELKMGEVEIKGKTFKWFEKIEISSEQGYIRFQLNNELSKHLIAPSFFVIASLESFLKLKSYYSKRIYLVSSQFARMRKFNISIDRLKNMMMVPDSLNQYSNFKERVIKLALKQINEYSDISLKIEELKIGRFVKDLEIIVTKAELVKVQKVKINKNQDTVQVGERTIKRGVLAVENWLERHKQRSA